MKSRLSILLVLVAALGLGAAPQAPVKPLTKDQIMELVKGSVNNEHVANLIRDRGIDFDPTEEYFQALRDAGAEQVLIDAFASARTIKPPPPDPAAQARQHVKEAMGLIGAGDNDGAIALCQKAIDESPRDGEAHRVLGIVYGKKKDWARDAAEQRVAILLNPDDAAAKAELTFALRSADPEVTRTDVPRTAPAVKTQVQVEDTGEQARKAFADGQLQVGQRKFEAAAISFSEAAQLKPDWADPLVERAKVYMKLYLFQEAIHSYDQAVQLKANDPVTLNLRGYAYYSASLFPQAIRDFDEAIRLDPSSVEAFQNRGNAKWQLGDKIGANADFEQAKALGSGTSSQRKGKRR